MYVISTCTSSQLSRIHVHALDMIIDNDPPIERNVSVPRDLGGLSCSSFTAGIVEAVLDGLGFVRYRFASLCSYYSQLPAAGAGHSAWDTHSPASFQNDDFDQIRKICT